MCTLAPFQDYGPTTRRMDQDVTFADPVYHVSPLLPRIATSGCATYAKGRPRLPPLNPQYRDCIGSLTKLSGTVYERHDCDPDVLILTKQHRLQWCQAHRVWHQRRWRHCVNVVYLFQIASFCHVSFMY